MKAVCVLFVILLAVDSSAAQNAAEKATSADAQRWNEFLQRKYKTHAALCRAWQCRSEPFGSEMLPGHLESSKWYPETDSETVCRKIQSGGIFRFAVEKNGKESWHPLLIAGKQTFRTGTIYTFSIRAKADKECEISVGIWRDEGNYANLGFSAILPLTTDWRTFTFSFIPKESCSNARFNIGRFKAGIYEFTGATLKQGGVTALTADETLESAAIPLIDKNGYAAGDAVSYRWLPKEAAADFGEFLQEQQKTDK
ncbi:MAG: carbohydrate binding domain-containing protein [Planctomycetaceae bacterium]|jgi:hypothetical protein|nr:carbohydrate binding domain-containing protein [Planctomycetaceae bacterium]